MSDTPPIEEAPKVVAEEVDDNVPPVPVVEPPKEEDKEPDWQGPLSEIAARVEEISTKLAAIVTPGTGEDIIPDEKPIKRPWTHRGFGRG